MGGKTDQVLSGFRLGAVRKAREQIQECLEVLQDTEAALDKAGVNEDDAEKAFEKAREAVEKVSGAGVLSAAAKAIAALK